ncbi:SULT1C3 [Symbiodinium sp. CCMP2592]|nr:SULT1C3 [Symbiodinium sp. CCMP2592]
MAQPSDLLCQPLIDQTRRAIQEKGASLVRQAGFVYQLNLRDGGPQGNFTLDLRHGSGSLQQGVDPRADVTFHILDADLAALGKGTLSVSNALRHGRLDIKGDQLATQVLMEVLERIQREYSPDYEPPKIISDDSARRWRIGAVLCFLLVVVLCIIIVNPFEVSRGSGGPREMEIVAHMSESNLQKLGNGVVKKLQKFTTMAFKQLFPWKESMGFESKPSDVLIAGSMGSGTTWLSHILHGLRVDGSLDFEDLNQVVTWYDVLGSKKGPEMLASQERMELEPRILKSHHVHAAAVANVRYVVLMRDPQEVLFAQHRLFCNGTWARLAGLKPNDVPVGLYASAFFARVNANDVWYHILSWYKCCWSDPQVAWVTYEDLLDDLSGQIRRLARFLLPNLPGSEILKKIVAQSSRDFMLQHQSKFDNHLLLEPLTAFKEKDGSTPRLPRVLPREEVEVDKRIVELCDVRWSRIVTPKTGFDSYAEMRAAIRARAAPSYGAGPLDLSSTVSGMPLSVIIFLLSVGLFAAAISFQPQLCRSVAIRLRILASAYYRWAMSQFSNSKKMDPDTVQTTRSGFVV